MAVPPPVVLLPSETMHAGDAEAKVVLREVDGRLLVLAYTSPEALTRCCGDEQAWVALPATEVEELALRAHAEAVVLNLPLS